MEGESVSPESSVPNALADADWGREINPPPPAEVVETPAETTDVQRGTSEVDDAATLARERGWKPKEEWKGDDTHWVDADSYNDRYEKLLPLRLDKDNRRLAQQLKDSEARIAELTRKATEWEKFQGEQTAARTKLQRDTLEMEMSQAFEAQDKDGFMRAFKALKDFDAGIKPQQVTAQQVDPVIKRTLEDFVADNPIFKDPKMGAVLSEQATLMRAAGATLVGREFLDEAKERVERMYPERFRTNGGVPPRRHPLGETGGAPTGGRSSKTKNWNDLKPEAREALEKFIQTTPGATREGILKSATEDYFRT